MPFSNRDVHHPLVQRIRTRGELSDAAESALRLLPVELARIGPKVDVVSAQEPADTIFFIIEGTTASYKLDGNGKRQIVSLDMRGDMPDLLTLHLPRVDTSICALNECQIARVRRRDVRALCRENSEVADSLWQQSLVDASILREWVCNLGSREGLGRLAHLLCEIVLRKEGVGVGTREACPFELSQLDLADATGMTGVHVNRLVQQLRQRSLIRLSRRMLSVVDWEGLCELADWNPDYLFRKVH